MAVKRTEDPPIHKEMKSTEYVNIYRSEQEIVNALNKEESQKFEKKSSLLRTICNLGSKRGYTKLS